LARLLTLIVATSFAASLVGAPKPKEVKAPVYMPTAVGTKWVYDDNGREWVEEVIKAEAKDGATLLTVRHTTAGNEFDETVAVLPEGVFDRGNAHASYDFCRLRLPVKPGKSWEVSVAPMKGVLSLSGTTTVGDAEKVVVPAGTFEAFPVRLEQTIQNGKRLDKPEVTTWWWAPDVGVIRVHSTGVDRKLKAFTLGK
jgi:hypothetical protein